MLYYFINLEIVWPRKYRSKSWCTTFAMAPFDCKYLISYLMAIVTFALALTICEIFVKIIKCQKFWQWKWRSRSRSRRTELVPFDWKCLNPYSWIFFRILVIWQHTFTQKVTHTQVHTQTGVMTIDKVCKECLTKKNLLTQYHLPS